MPKPAAAMMLLTAVALAASACIGPPDRRDVLANLADFVFVPAFEEAADAAQALATAANRLADDPAPGRLDRARGQWQAASAAWAATAAFRFGPAMDRRSASLVDWWPIDRDAIQDAAAAGASADDIAERQSAATRGLYAIEAILAEDLPIDSARLRYAARLAGVIAAELAAISASLALSDVVRTSIFLTETIGDMRLGKALGVTGDRDPDAIPGLGSSTGDDLRGAVRGIRQSFLGTGDHLAVGTLVNELDDNAFDRMQAALDAAVDAVDALPADIKAGDGDDALRAARDAIKQIQILYATEIVSLLGISVGFSDNDGDS